MTVGVVLMLRYCVPQLVLDLSVKKPWANCWAEVIVGTSGTPHASWRTQEREEGRVPCFRGKKRQPTMWDLGRSSHRPLPQATGWEWWPGTEGGRATEVECRFRVLSSEFWEGHTTQGRVGVPSNCASKASWNWTTVCVCVCFVSVESREFGWKLVAQSLPRAWVG